MNEDTMVKGIKSIAGIAITIGVAAIVGNAVKFTTPEVGMGTLKKFCVGLGSVVLGGLASDASVQYAEKKIDEATELVKEVSKTIEVASETTVETEVTVET